MIVKSRIENRNSKIVIVGAGPAGSSLAIRLANRGFRVTLIERDRFPREKLCGEFISPECFRHFEQLGVKHELFAKDGSRITETRFYAATGRSVSVPTSWFGNGDFALSLSRAEMDHALLLRARRSLGVDVLEDTRAIGVELDDGFVRAIIVKDGNGGRTDLQADLFIDATGRSAVVSNLVEKQLNNKPMSRPKLVAFKNHFTDAKPDAGICEIYFFKGGYGGLSPIEGGRSNLCFIVKSDVAKEFIGKTNKMLELVISGNGRARNTLAEAKETGDWLAVPIAEFGTKARPVPPNLFAIGDAGAFIDPFTGSGMLMAMESSELFAKLLAEYDSDLATLHRDFGQKHEQEFSRRLLSSSILRRAAFVPRLAEAAIFATGLNDRFRELLARSTRSGSRPADNIP